MRISYSTLALAFVIALPLAACKSGEKRYSTTSVESKEYRACCAKECDASCPKECCQEHFANTSTTGEYCSNCGKACDASCTMACCKK